MEHPPFAGILEVAGDIGPPLQRGDFPPDAQILDLPHSHLALLTIANGFTIYHGAIRMLGLRPEPWADLRSWNHPETWRFAWDDRLAPFVMFGGTVWGDQYAYKISASGILEPEVYFLESTMMRHEVIAESFEEFSRKELARNAVLPYDEMTVAAIQKFGAVPFERNFVYSPSLALGGEEALDHVLQLGSAAAMIYAGDIAIQIQRLREGTAVKRVEQWTDSTGRARLRLVTSN